MKILNVLKLFIILYLSTLFSCLHNKNLKATIKEKKQSGVIPPAPPLPKKIQEQANKNNYSNLTKSSPLSNENKTLASKNSLVSNITNSSTDQNETSVNKSNPYYIPYFQKKDNNITEFLPVSFVKELSPAGKKELEIRESGDDEYFKILNSGFETPKFTNNIINKYETPVTQSYKLDDKWRPIDSNDANLWKNVEFNKYGNNLIQDKKSYTPAKFVNDEFGNTVVHGPQDSGVRIIKSIPSIQNLRQNYY